MKAAKQINGGIRRKIKNIIRITVMTILSVLLISLCGCGETNGKSTTAMETTEKETVNETESSQTMSDREKLEAATKSSDSETKVTENANNNLETAETEAAADISTLPAGTVLSLEEVETYGEDNCFTVSEISDETFARMWGKSYKEYCTVPREDLRYIRCLHTDIDGRIMIGELVMNAAVAEDVCGIFHKLYTAGFPIEKMHLVDDYDAVDDYSIYHDNTSAFNYRTIAGTDTLSNHAYGLAIDINPYYNVYYEPASDYVFPAECYEYKYRDQDFIYKVGPGDLCYELFTEAGFDWGGWWEDTPDYQHFEKVIY